MLRSRQQIGEECSKKLGAVVSLEGIDEVLADFANAIGFQFDFMRAVIRRNACPGVTMKTGNYPASWANRYLEKSYSRIDPVLAHAKTRSTPALLHKLPPPGGRDCQYREFLDDAYDAGILNGLTIPLSSTHLWGYLNFNAPKCGQLMEDAVCDALLLSAGVTEGVLRSTNCRTLAAAYGKLTRREREVLFWASAGKTAWETGRILGITERTVIAHLAKSMFALDCINKAQLVGAVAHQLQADYDMLPLREGF